jgi:hypothetical protein
MTRKLNGPSLVGFGDFFDGPSFGDDVVGATKGQPPKVTPYPKPKHNPAIEKHGKVLTAARKTATTAAKKILSAAKLLKSPIAKAKPVHVGAVAASKLTPKQQAAVQKHNSAVIKSTAATKKLAGHVAAAHKSVGALAKAMIAQKKIATKLRPHPVTKTTAPARIAKPTVKPVVRGKAPVRVGDYINDDVIGADVKAALNDYYTTIGADPDPNNPGYLTDGTPDPAYASMGSTDANGLSPGQSGYDPTTDPSSPQFGGGALADSPMDTGAPLPPAPDLSYQEQDGAAAGGIMYRGEKGQPDGYCGSLGLMTKSTDSYTIGSTPGIDGTDHFGYVWGKFHDNEVPNGIAFGDDLKSGQWNHVRGRHSGAGDYWNGVALPEAVASNAKNSPQGKPYGPLVGNPGMPDFAHMRVDYGGNMFWYPQEAPDWVTFPLKQAAALTAQAAAKAQADAAAAAAQAQATAQAQQQAAQAAQDAQNALAESAATSAANVQATQTAAQQAQDEEAANAQADLALVEQQHADTAEQQFETDQAAQFAPLVLQQSQQQLQAQQQMLDYAAQHPDEAYGPMSGDGGGDDGVPVDDDGVPYDDGSGDTAMPGMDFGNGGEGDYDDGTATPGGDVMSDADGEGFPG